MFTSIDKALVALFFSILYLVNTFFGINIGVSEEVVAAIVSVLAPLAVYLIPNKSA